MRTAFERCATDGTPYDLELEKITARGRRIWVRTIGQAERDAQGRIVRIQGAFQEISSRKQNERAARELAERLRTTLESITDAFCTLDRDWRFTYANRQAEQLFDRPCNSLLGVQIWDDFPQLLGTPFERELRRAWAGELPVHFEEFHRRLDKWFAVTAYPSSQGLAVQFRDVTDARAARQRLELLEASVAQINDIVLITEATPLADPGPRILFVNDAFVRITGHAREAVLGRSPRLLQGALTDRSELDRIRAALSRFEPVHGELVNYTQGGVPYWVELDIVPVGLDGQTCPHFVAVMRDITERKRTQRALIESRERLRLLNNLSDATRALDEPAQIMAATSRMLGQYLHASLCAYAELDADGERLTILHEYANGCASTVGSYPLSLFGARARAALTGGQPLVVRNVDAELLPGEGAHVFNALGIQAIVCVPLVGGGDLRAMMIVMQTATHARGPHRARVVGRRAGSPDRRSSAHARQARPGRHADRGEGRPGAEGARRHPDFNRRLARAAAAGWRRWRRGHTGPRWPGPNAARAAETESTG